MLITQNKVVTIDYTLKDEDGEVIDSSVGSEPLMFLFGAGNIISGLEKALEGKKEGEAVQVSVKPEEGYGLYRDELVQEVALDMFESGVTVVPGMQFQAEQPEGVVIFTVLSVGDKSAVLDGNHPLAGSVLNFDVKVLGIRDATKTELDHGHVHAPGHHHH
ncbi:MAG TPA: peptidylprolyl isomerase [Leptospiraceae bacterium]|nr:peptidylprolyl isomerase [Leptospiraceae bacterium]HMY69717.1 peptidylprolyl isomerase [Leptospiraceae bacterium]HMZ60170.1 peptidylprolyl isomerase [Leptospiraceae bacterium]HNF15580.1 peptidylprolyl isomerase [Leptospiraceae bacterium]HNF24314.1 peptidylprolyl isomerase [Leptospiraceae bacterium]